MRPTACTVATSPTDATSNPGSRIYTCAVDGLARARLTPGGPQRTAVVLVALIALVSAVLGACSDSGDDTSGGSGTPAPVAAAGSGPFFGACGGVSTAEVSQIVDTAGLDNVTNNSSGCEWVTSADQLGPQFSFNWYRGSPIGRERATEQLSRDSTTDLTIDGHNGFIASSPGICEIGIAFGADFFEWSVSFGVTASGETDRSTEQVCDAAKKLSTTTIERAK